MGVAFVTGMQGDAPLLGGSHEHPVAGAGDKVADIPVTGKRGHGQAEGRSN